MASQFEIIAKLPPIIFRSKYIALHLELQEIMKKVPKGKSIRIPYGRLSEARAYRNSVNVFIKKNGLKDKYFAACPSMAEEGKFYVWIGQRE